ncbi:MAG TPA: MarR family transcriptional regulator [Candidatus Binatia bacterium]|nr:MarR family transcriptional regulator [Candidatus Binatia bacterium]
MSAKPPARDQIDEMLDVWSREIPDLDRLTEGILERIQIVAWAFNQSLEENLAQSGIDRRAFNLLGKLRKHGPPYRASAGKLATDLRLSSGAMTNRLDRMEAAGLIRRVPDPNDRRGTMVEPTELGLQKWDEVAGLSSRTESNLMSVLTESEKERLYDLLRKLMQAFPDWKQKKHAHPIAEDE